MHVIFWLQVIFHCLLRVNSGSIVGHQLHFMIQQGAFVPISGSNMHLSWPRLKPRFLGPGYLNFGLFEVWQKSAIKYFYRESKLRHWLVRDLPEVLGRTLKKSSTNAFYYHPANLVKDTKIKSLAGSEQKLQIWPFGHILVVINGHK